MSTIYTSIIVSLPEYIGFDRNGSPVIDLHRLLVYSHIKMIVIVSLLFAFLQDKELNRMSIEASANRNRSRDQERVKMDF